ncbi:MAG TPA: RagB/SusD family nutrient uptake outer membrane protein [Bacteroidales bacterium]|nr:RagB/SusD family nutrient uptake outer membrane protein [Bacteroidales bacterium]
MKKVLNILFTIALLAGVLVSCNKDSLEPTLAQSKEIVEGSISTVGDVKSILLGAYDRMTNGSYYGRDYIIEGEVRGDNCFSNGNSGRFVRDAKMDWLEDNVPSGWWSAPYAVIASANIIIALEADAIVGDAAVFNHYKGEAYAIRAMAHFDLLRYFGQQHVGGTLGVPYIKVYKGDDYTPARNTLAECETFIMEDIDMGISLMNPAQDDASKQLLTHWGGEALKSRFALYFGDWPAARDAALAVINSDEYDIIPAAGFVNFWKSDGGVNSIFELAYSGTDNNNINGLQQIYRGASYGDVEGLKDLYDAFDVGDIRASAAMIGPDPDPTLLIPKPYVNLGKYPGKNYEDDIYLIRYEEVVLNYAEALWRINPADGNALTQLNLITSNRNAVAHAAIDEDIILLERRRELCFEGFRFHDLARTGRDIPLVSPLQQTHEGPAYGSYKYAFPIPLAEMNANSAMEQNPNY